MFLLSSARIFSLKFQRLAPKFCSKSVIVLYFTFQHETWSRSIFFNLFCSENFVFKGQSQQHNHLSSQRYVCFFSPKTIVIFAQGDTKAGTVGFL